MRSAGARGRQGGGAGVLAACEVGARLAGNTGGDEEVKGTTEIIWGGTGGRAEAGTERTDDEMWCATASCVRRGKECGARRGGGRGFGAARWKWVHTARLFERRKNHLQFSK